MANTRTSQLMHSRQAANKHASAVKQQT